MSIVINTCPRCSSQKMTFDIGGQTAIDRSYKWQLRYEVFCVCRNCYRPTIFLIELDVDSSDWSDELAKPNALINGSYTLNNFFNVVRFINIRDNLSIQLPDNLPDNLNSIFKEGATCFSVGCYNAAATMFRLCVDIVTRPLLPEKDASLPQPNEKQRRDLGLRLPWLFENKFLPLDLQQLAKCIHQDGNDGAHVGNLIKEDAEDLLDFTNALLDRLITQPNKLLEAEERRNNRRATK